MKKEDQDRVALISRTVARQSLGPTQMRITDYTHTGWTAAVCQVYLESADLN